MTNTVAQPQPRTALTIYMAIAQLIALSTLLIWLIIIGTALLFFDSKPRAGDAFTIVVACLYPIYPVGLSIVAWIAYAQRRNIAAAILIGLAAVPVMCICLSMLSSIAL